MTAKPVAYLQHFIDSVENLVRQVPKTGKSSYMEALEEVRGLLEGLNSDSFLFSGGVVAEKDEGVTAELEEFFKVERIREEHAKRVAQMQQISESNVPDHLKKALTTRIEAPIVPKVEINVKVASTEAFEKARKQLQAELDKINYRNTNRLDTAPD